MPLLDQGLSGFGPGTDRRFPGLAIRAGLILEPELGRAHQGGADRIEHVAGAAGGAQAADHIFRRARQFRRVNPQRDAGHQTPSSVSRVKTRGPPA